MARDGFDCSELMEFADTLGAQPKALHKAQRKLLREQGTKLRRRTAQRARAEVNRTAVHRPKYDRAAGTYHKSIKRGRVYEKDGRTRIRVYTSDPIGHLVEDGWTPKARNGKRGKHRDGQQVFDTAAKEFEPEFYEAADDMLDEVIGKI